MDLSEVLIISNARSGTNYFCETIGEFDGMLNMFELFNKKGPFGLHKLPELLEKIVGPTGGLDPIREDVSEAVAQDRLGFIESVRENVARSGYNSFSYKVFRNQMSEDELSQLIASMHGMCIVIARSRLDSFISARKAFATGSWSRSSTEEVDLTVNVNEFLRWSRKVDEWYDLAERLIRAHGKQYIIYSYESDINVPKPMLVEKIYLGLRSAGVDLPFPTTIAPPTYVRQDTVRDPFEKIANGAALEEALRKRNLLENYALRPFVVKPSVGKPS